MIRQAFGEESMSQRGKATILPTEKSKLTEPEKGAIQVMRKVKRMFVIFFNTKGIVYK
jgi:hypothetical protein